MKPWLTLWLSIGVIFSVTAAETAKEENVPVENPWQWIPLPDARLEVCGLPWWQENAPEWWRLPKSARAQVPPGVWNRAVAPDGGRIRLASDTSRLAIRVAERTGEKKRFFFDVYADGVKAGSVEVKTGGQGDFLFFESQPRKRREIVIYLPHKNEPRVLAVGVDAAARLEPAAPFARRRPLVCYGSSVLQGTGATHPAQTYPAILARRLNCDFVNLGFGGAGKAEPEVVALVNSLDAGCFLFDLGKSYGDQTMEPYARMLAAIRVAHPKTPIICVTPIYSTKEASEPAYREKSEKLRAWMRQAAHERRQAGDEWTFVVEGLDLFGPADKEFFHDPQHPNDEGNERIAARLVPLVRKAWFAAGNKP